MKNKIRVAELFAGVGGFRIGLEGYNGKSATSNFTKKLESIFEIVWSNQFEPSTPSRQHASEVYESKFSKGAHSNMSITDVVENYFDTIPDHDLLVGGFPCQDYSVATTLRNSKGLIGKKGVLWWDIYNILDKKGSKKPKYLILENVDRLLISPSLNKGRDFAIILSCLNSLGYAVEWRVINAAEYGMPQRRKRVFILAYLKGTDIYNDIESLLNSSNSLFEWITQLGLLVNAFPVNETEDLLFLKQFVIPKEPKDITAEFNKDNKRRFENAGIMYDGKAYTLKTTPNYKGPYTLLKDIIINNEDDIDEDFFIEDDTKWITLKGKKDTFKTNKDNITYRYSEGQMAFPDPIDRPSRTIITGEGGKSPSRFKHVIEQNNRLRRLTPVELERLNMFPDNHTKLDGISDAKRAFFMGNALVVGIVEKIGSELAKRIENGQKK